MHQQIRTVPARPSADLVDPSADLKPAADLVEFLGVLAAAGLSIKSAGGSNLHSGGEFAFGLLDDEYEKAMGVLTQERYQPRLVDVDYRAIPDEAGELLRFVTEVTQRNLEAKREILDIAIGVPDADGLIQVQVYSGSK